MEMGRGEQPMKFMFPLAIRWKINGRAGCNEIERVLFNYELRGDNIGGSAVITKWPGSSGIQRSTVTLLW